MKKITGIKKMKRLESMQNETKAVRAGQSFDPTTRALIPPPYLTSTFVQERPGVSEFEYCRTDNPSFRNLEKGIASIEKGAADCVVFSSGTSAITAVLSLLNPGERLLCDQNVYSGTRRLMSEYFARYGIDVTYADATEVAFLNEIKDVKLIWIETPSNPLLRVNDIERIAQAAKGVGSLLCVDSTFATPLNQSPLRLGADIVLYSTTKYIAGHSDVIGGAVTGTNPSLVERLRWFRNALGLNPSPFDCWLIQRGLKTLPVRLREQERSALRIALWLEKQAFVENVIYPGLESNPQYEIAKKQMKGFSGMISVVLALSPDEIEKRLSRLKLWQVAESLGGVESLVDYPWLMTQSGLSEEERLKTGIPPKLLRLSVGLEKPEDLIDDLEKAFG